MTFTCLTSLDKVFSAKGLWSLISSASFSDSPSAHMGNGSGDYGPNGSNAAILGALGTLIGYVGTEISVNDLFERLLWPQRHYNSPPTQALWKMAFLMPMGGPLHKAALRTLDTLHEKGLFKGSRRGHMLGTAFFRDTGRTYNAYEGESLSTVEHVRNGMWVRAVDQMPGLLKDPVSAKPRPDDAPSLTRNVRQQICVSHIYLRRPAGKLPDSVIKEDTHDLGWMTLGWIIATETTGIAVAFVVVLVWRSAFMLLWLLPLLLKLVSACFPVPRQGLAASSRAASIPSQDRVVRFEIVSNGNGFQIIEGEESLAVQFFRHYGHPIRSRGRELLQMTIVIIFGLLFPAGLLCSLLWMPTGMQTVWLSYQLYTVIALHVYHFAGGHHWATTEEKICRAFRDAEAKHEDAEVVFGTDIKSAVHATLIRTSHDSFADGRAHVSRLLSSPYCKEKDSQQYSRSPSRETSGSAPSDTPLLCQKTPDPVGTSASEMQSRRKL
ncbi:MAG: hypothetical protein Q9180_001278 [Flavoplaca navasiana]